MDEKGFNIQEGTVCCGSVKMYVLIKTSISKCDNVYGQYVNSLQYVNAGK